MQSLSIYCHTLKIGLKTGPDIYDMTSELIRLVATSEVYQGSLIACMVGSTGSITTIEYEPGVVEDLKRAFNRLAPPNLEYAHEEAWHDGNGHSHVQAALVGPSIVLAIRSGRLQLGTWQQVVAVNHDNRPRTRNIEVTITGVSK